MRAISASRARGKDANSAISRPSKVTESASALTRLPWHIRHTSLVTNSETRFLTIELLVFAKVSSTNRRAPTKLPS